MGIVFEMNLLSDFGCQLLGYKSFLVKLTGRQR